MKGEERAERHTTTTNDFLKRKKNDSQHKVNYHLFHG